MNPRLKQLSTVDNAGMPAVSGQLIAISGGVPDYTYFQDGNATSPSVTNVTDSTTGLYWQAAPTRFSVSVSGNHVADFNANSLSMGSARAIGWPDIFITRAAAGVARIGTTLGNVDGIYSAGAFRGGAGSPSAPTFNFSNNSGGEDDGFYSVAAGQIGVAISGTNTIRMLVSRIDFGVQDLVFGPTAPGAHDTVFTRSAESVMQIANGGGTGDATPALELRDITEGRSIYLRMDDFTNALTVTTDGSTSGSAVYANSFGIGPGISGSWNSFEFVINNAGSNRIDLGSDWSINWSNATNNVAGGLLDLALERDNAAGALKIYDPSASADAGIHLRNAADNAGVWITNGGSGLLEIGSTQGARNGLLVATTISANLWQSQSASDLTIQPASGQSLILNDEGGTASITIATSGRVTFGDDILAFSGTVGGPGISFAADGTTGFYYVGGSMRATASGTLHTSFNAADLSVEFPVLVPNGLVSAPALSFTSDTNTGIYRIIEDVIGIVCGGVTILEIAEGGTEYIGLFESGGNVVYMHTDPTYDRISFSTALLTSDAGITTSEYVMTDRNSDPTLPGNGSAAIWLSNGTGTGNDGDVLIKITDSVGSTRTVVLSDAGTGGGGGGGTGTGPVERYAESGTGPHALNSDDYGKTLTDGVATALVEFDLPTAAQSGGPFTFLIESGSGIQVNAAAGDMIQVGNLTTTTTGGENITSSTTGDVITIRAINSSTWFATSGIGSWTVN